MVLFACLLHVIIISKLQRVDQSNACLLRGLYVWDTSLLRGIQDWLHPVGKASAWVEPGCVRAKPKAASRLTKALYQVLPKGYKGWNIPLGRDVYHILVYSDLRFYLCRYL